MLPVLLPSSQAIQQFHGALTSESVWTVGTSDEGCELVHVIPRYGRAVFSQAERGELRFALHVRQPPVRDGEALVRSVSPAWKHDGQPLDLGTVRVARGITPIRWGRALALRTYYELENGMMPQIYYRDWADARDNVVVALSPVRFLEVLPEFLACINALRSLHAVTTAGVGPQSQTASLPGTMVVHFATDSAVLAQDSEARLRRFAGAILALPGDRPIVIEGHADRRGTKPYNSNLSRRRARTVQGLLTRIGVGESRIVLRAYGELQPLDPRDNERAWSRNRRVAVTVRFADPSS
jgi:outer membrane protein OmpA-like peptidoglycan-associated protein